MNKDETADRLKVVNEQIQALTEERAELKQQLANMAARFKVGDQVTYDGARYVWQITDIRPGRYGDEVSYWGAKLKKDGTAGALVSDIYVSYGKTLRLANV